MTGRAFAAAAGALGVLLAVLAGVLAGEFRTPPRETAPAAALAGTVRAAPPAVRAASDAAGNAAAALARPLFDPSRRPPAAGTAVAADLPRLTGVLVSGAGRVALFAGPEGRGTAVAAGGAVGPFTVRTVEPGLVVIDGPSGSRALRPSFEGARPAVAEAPPPPGPARVPMEDLLRGAGPSYPPTPGLPVVLGAAGPQLPPSGTAGQMAPSDLLGASFPGLGVPGLAPLRPPGAPSPFAPPGPR